MHIINFDNLKNYLRLYLTLLDTSAYPFFPCKFNFSASNYFGNYHRYTLKQTHLLACISNINLDTDFVIYILLAAFFSKINKASNFIR